MFRKALGLVLLWSWFSAGSQPINNPTRIGETVVDQYILEKRPQKLRIKVADRNDFLIWKESERKHWILTELGNNIFEVSNFRKSIKDEISNSKGILFVDRANRKAEPEGVYGDFDPTLNAVPYVHSRYPEIDGSTVAVSIKEKPFDTSDIDLRGRIDLSGPFDEVSTQHATFMATIAAGGGNTAFNTKGGGWKSKLHTADFDRLLPDPAGSFIQKSISVQNHSYGVGLENYYGLEASEYDLLIYQNPTLLHVFSSGNKGSATPTDGQYKGLSGFANLTGQFKNSKNSIAVGSVNRMGILSPISSRGPTQDGRVKPELVAFGDAGSSESAAVISGIALLIQDAYNKKFGKLPSAALVKAALINGATDIGRPNVDFDSGYGIANAGKAVETILENRFFESTLTQGAEEPFSIIVDEHTRQLKVTLAWTDPPADPFSIKTLIHDLDLTVEKADKSETWLPWILNDTPESQFLISEATRGIDRKNNVEQITIDFPSAGEYFIKVAGHYITNSNQEFHVVYETFKRPEFIWPLGGVTLSAGKPVTIRWNWQGPDETGELYFRKTQQVNWTRISAIERLSIGYFNWNLPDNADSIQFKLTYNAETILSDDLNVATELKIQVGYDCEEDILIFWNKEKEATGYEVLNLGEQYLQPILTTSDTFAILNRSQLTTNYFSVRAVFLANRSTLVNTLNIKLQGIGCYIKSFFAQKYITDKEASFILDLGTSYGLKEIILERQENDSFKFLERLNQPFGTRFAFTDAKPIKGGNQYRIRLVRNNEEQVFSEPVSVISTSELKLFIFPNPVHAGESLNILFDTEEEVEIEVLDIFGKRLTRYSDVGSVKELSTAHLPKGLYFLKVSSGERQDVLPLIVK